ncbi:DUF2510 domain-containing protein [Streptomyces sp. BE147]|uniref:DUF2510 domain-containing protein n=1 Tax=unclassified Streptomyces TaxID=2593676 RepID=UPI002E7A4DBE|nr:DUF2510 domain-containing protein [Streptomyces sp. BE147]MEE1740798.1 DUF2510 domain-containing protein [Streptomyces sp. BE147]
MSHATPPGWYPDAGAPGTERWWDGTAWTAHTRPLAAAPPGPQQPYAAQSFGPPPLPVLPRQRTGGSAPPGGGARTRILAVALSGLVIAGVAVTAAVLLGGDDSGTGPAVVSSGSAPPATAPATASGGTTAPGDPPDEDPGTLTDQLNGITLPVPVGWEKPESTVDDAITMRTIGSYSCPGDSGASCYHGTVTTRTPSRTDATTPEALAEQDITTAADSVYEENLVGRRVHGGIVSHKVLRSEPVSVAGRTGYLVRWQVTTGKGPGGVVQSVAFPSAVGSETPVLVRMAFDAGRKDLPLSLMDTITRGIRPVGDSGTGGGVGSSIAP